MKLVLAVILSACVVYASAAEECGALQRFKVKHQWAETFGHGHERLEFGLRLFARLFHDHPTTRALFTRVHSENIFSPEFKAHADRLLGGLDMTIGLLDDNEAVKAQIHHLKDQHATRNVKPEYYEALRDELFPLLAKQLGTKFDFAAWLVCFNGLIKGMQGH